MSWLTTEAVRTRTPVLELGDTLTDFFRNVLEVKNITGGKRGTGTLIVEQMKRLFGSMVSATYSGLPAGKTGAKGFSIRNVMIAEGMDLEESLLWTPQKEHEAGAWKSQLRLTDNFFREITERPVPIDMRAYTVADLSLDEAFVLYSSTNRILAAQRSVLVGDSAGGVSLRPDLAVAE